MGVLVNARMKGYMFTPMYSCVFMYTRVCFE